MFASVRDRAGQLVPAVVLFSSLRGYRRSWVAADVLAALTLLVIAVPEQLATSRLADMPPITGFYAFAAGTALFALLGSNPQMSVGADSTIAPLFAVGVAHMAPAGSHQYVDLLGKVRSAGRVVTTPRGLDVLAESLRPDDQVALEATGNALAIARRIEPHVVRVVVAVRKELRAITEAKVKTDRLDARMLARLLAAGLLNGCWLPDERTRSLRRRLARRAQLVRHRTRCKNEVHAVLLRNLKGRPPMTDAFGKSGRVWLSGIELPRDERQTVDGCLRQIDFLNEEVALLEREIATHALDSAEIKRLMTVPGVSLMTAATFMAAVGDIDRFQSPRKLVGYLGLDPTVRQSGSTKARHGRISKQGASQTRAMLAEAAFVSVSTPSPMRAFYQRVSARRGKQVAIIAVARKLVVLFWHLLTRDEDYAFARPSLTAHKLRELELRAGAERHVGSRSLRHKSGYHQQPNRDRERELSALAELAYRRLFTDWKRANPERNAAMT